MARLRPTGPSGPAASSPLQTIVVLCMENHYKDGTWRYPEFAQPEDVFEQAVDQLGDAGEAE